MDRSRSIGFLLESAGAVIKYHLYSEVPVLQRE